jgi:hypothetical protein
MKKLIIISQAIGLTLSSLLIVGVTWLVFSLVSDGFRASLMRFEGEPPEGWEYWRRKEFYEALPANAAFALMMLILAYFVGRGWWRWSLNLHKNWNTRRPHE